MSVLLIAEHNNTDLRPFTFNAATAASKINEDLHVLVLGNKSDSVAKAASEIPLVKKVIHVDNEIFDNFTAENYTSTILKHVDNYSHIVCSANTFGKNLMPRVAAKLDTQQISDIISVESDDTFKRPIYAGSCIATVKSNDAVKVITVRSTAFDPVGTDNNGVEVVSVDASDSLGISSFLSEELAQSDRPELTAANIVISGGRGMQSGDNFHLLDSIADKLGAAVGASRAAVDAGFVPNDYQVGQTGKIVAPDLYIAVGISGAIQHLAGMKDSKVIVAINKDEDAPIFQVADYGLVGDLFNVLPEMDSKI